MQEPPAEILEYFKKALDTSRPLVWQQIPRPDSVMAKPDLFLYEDAPPQKIKRCGVPPMWVKVTRVIIKKYKTNKGTFWLGTRKVRGKLHCYWAN